ncbi:MAG TPA: hypothetical protein VMI31_17280 [Fimbriimonadaceae bacterium]|nr:hypothetical protein [Fimbriimonadaceae bacterium]
MSVLDDQPVIEASLGGRIDLLEMKTLAEDLEELFADWNGEPFYLLLDYSKAVSFDEKTVRALDALKEKAFEFGAEKVFSVPHEDSQIEDHVAARMQSVLEGKEEFLMYAHQAQFAPLPKQAFRRAA